MTTPPNPAESYLGQSSPGDERLAFLREILAGLQQYPKMLPGKYLWDTTGSVLFDQICASADYYPTKRELALLPGVAAELASLIGAGATIVEFGAGASRKVRILLDTLDKPARFVAVDIAGDYLEASLQALAPAYPGIAMLSVIADYSNPIRLPVALDETPVLGFFPGSTIGNFDPSEVERFLARIRDALGPSHFLVGTDPTQNESRLLKAYGECDGLMPALHLNILARLERDLGAVIDRDAFRHEVRIKRDPFRVEAHLVASRATIWHLDGHRIAFKAGESVRTDTSYKYTPEIFQHLAERSGWTTERQWLDTEGQFSLHLLRC